MAIAKASISAMNLLSPTPKKGEDLISISSPGIHNFCQLSSVKDVIVEQRLVGVIRILLSPHFVPPTINS